MTAPNTAVAAPDVSSATSFENEVGALFGDVPTSSHDDAPPDPDTTSAAGTTPAEPAAETASEATGATAPSGAADTVTPSDGITPAAAETVQVEDDPFKDSVPATYVVNGQSIPVEDIRVFKEGGAVIRPDALPNVLSKLAARDTLEAKERTTSQQYQTLAKVTEWTDTASNKTYTGPEAAIEMRIGNASLLAENQLLVDHLTDPDKLYSLLTTEQVPDGKGGVRERVILNPAALQTLQRENALTQRELAAKIRDHFRGVIAEHSKPQAAPINFEQATPLLVAEVAKGANLDASVLTAADRQMLAEQLPFHIKDGLASIAWQNLVKRMIQDRGAQKTSAATLVATTTAATKEGQARMAAAARGVKPNAAPVRVAPAKPAAVSPNQERMDNEAALFDAMISSGAAAMRSQRQG